MEFRNIVICKLKHLGDVLTTTPVATAAKSLWPQARISYLINPGGEDLVRWHPAVDQVITVPRNAGLTTGVGFPFFIRRQKFDLFLELSGGDRGAFLARFSGARTRVGYVPKRKKKKLRWRAFTHPVTTRGSSKHTVEYHLDALRALGVEPGYQPLSLFRPPEAEAEAERLLIEAGLNPARPFAVVHPTSRWMFKAWRPAGYVEVVDWLTEQAGLPVVLTSAPEPLEMVFVREILAHVKRPAVDLSGRLSLSVLAAVIGRARLFFGVDSLPMHMAAAVDTPAVALFGPSGEHMWGPWGEGHQVVAKDWDCRPCGRAGCDDSGVSRCLEEIETREITAALQKVLEADR